MLRNDKWLAVIDDLLHGEAGAHRAARATLWREVIDFVVRRARLPIGRLGDDEEARRDIAVRLLTQLEKRDYAHVREWERRQRRGRDAARWWTFVSILLRHRAIDHARGSKLNTVSRDEGFQFAVVEPAAPIVFAEAVPSTMHFLSHCSGPALAEFLDRFNATRIAVRDPEPPPTTRARLPRRGRQDG